MDRLVYLNGRTYVRKFDDWEDGFGYKLYIGEEGGYQSYVEWALKEIDMQTSQLSITVHPYSFGWLSKVCIIYTLPLLDTPQVEELSQFCNLWF